MNEITRGRAALAAGLAFFFGACASPRIALVRGDSQGRKDVFEVRGLDGAFLAGKDVEAVDWSGVFTVRVAATEPSRYGEMPAVGGLWRLDGGILRFEPRFPLVPGLRYRAALLSGPWIGREKGREKGERVAVEESFALPPRDLKPKTFVDRVYPSASVLPENQLKLYIHFSGPMRRGQAYSRIRLVDADGGDVDTPFLELGEELWDPDGTRFTLFFDPARVKRGLRPREEQGPVLVAEKKYRLVIDAGWPDADGARLLAAFHKNFEVGAPDYDTPDPRTWITTAPAAGTTRPLVVEFPEPMDHALLHRLLLVKGSDGAVLDGTVDVGAEERVWRFVPSAAWKAGRHELIADTTIEDLAGNSIGRPFEVDMTRSLASRLEPTTFTVPFEVTPGGSTR